MLAEAGAGLDCVLVGAGPEYGPPIGLSDRAGCGVRLAQRPPGLAFGGTGPDGDAKSSRNCMGLRHPPGPPRRWVRVSASGPRTASTGPSALCSTRRRAWCLRRDLAVRRNTVRERVPPDRPGPGRPHCRPGRPWDVPRRSHEGVAIKNPGHSRSRTALTQEDTRSPHRREANAARKAPRKTRIPRPERFCLGTPGGAGGTRTHGRRIMSPLL